jgi:hypothetical protein
MCAPCFVDFKTLLWNLLFVNLVTPRIVRWLLKVLKTLCTSNIKENVYLILKIAVNSGTLSEL